MRYSLLSLFGLLAFCGFTLGALAGASYLLASVFFSFAVAVLCGAVVGVAISHGSQRAFWLAFAVFGWSHFVLSLGPWFDDHTGEFLLSRHCLDFLGSLMNQKVADHQTMPGIWLNLPYATRGSGYSYLTFVVIGQSAITLGIGWASGAVASYWYRRSAMLEASSRNRGPRAGNA
jgi:hypothetical protein